MADAQITCITKPNRESPYEHITHVGGSGWKWPREQVIASIDAGTNTFHVVDAHGHRSEVGVVDPGNGRARYLRTHANNHWNDNLLALPSCP